MSESIYEQLEVPTVINATGTKTRISGSLIRDEAMEAMIEASKSFVRIEDLQSRASESIADVTGAEAGYVTSGASAGLMMAAAACLAGDDLEVMAQLPETHNIPDEILAPRTHRTGYDHAIRAAGATIVDVGSNDRHLGTGSRNIEPWEIEEAIADNTAAIFYLEKIYTDPPLEVVTEIAHAHDIPVIVDAAAEVPPVSNLEQFIDEGADLVVYSGGKAIRGPQTTGILAGRRDLIESVALQHLDMHAAKDVWLPSGLIDTETLSGVPKQGIGRSLKVGKEELAGLIKALELFVEEDHDALEAEWLDRSKQIASELATKPGLATHTTESDKTAIAPEVVVSVDESTAGITTVDLVRGLRKEDPRVFVGADSLDAREFTINPMCLTDDEAAYVVERICSYL
ncbi:L-seryl-tRNA(Ser) seleniumtransferase [Halogranum amylolyticum]|uniref:L-seryl-tRNA(Ser) seleniumtransferase n=1 Tax=Halogranum amylolyticum TaxID=660520 RepID=A0A1H8UHH7_9EURY|nr:aminotransferase class V-fold PLP-dependent enzyme [Halogranum amylolyticum]SEP02645.1 L-seryl-tRNA(Ser) seleniumtransferase [Halogranum amylolyticum]